MMSAVISPLSWLNASCAVARLVASLFWICCWAAPRAGARAASIFQPIRDRPPATHMTTTTAMIHAITAPTASRNASNKLTPCWYGNSLRDHAGAWSHPVRDPRPVDHDRRQLSGTHRADAEHARVVVEPLDELLQLSLAPLQQLQPVPVEVVLELQQPLIHRVPRSDHLAAYGEDPDSTRFR